MAIGSNIQPYNYGDKELGVVHGLNQYDYSARYYDLGYGRFTTPAPLSEKFYSWSPYTYCKNNPLNRVDPDGKRDRRVAAGEIPGVEHRGRSVGNITASVVRTTTSTQIVGNSNENYGNVRISPTKVSLKISGQMRSSKLADTQVAVNAEFSDGQKSTAKNDQSVAGGFGNGAPENGKYSVNNYRQRGNSLCYFQFIRTKLYGKNVIGSGLPILRRFRCLVKN